MNANSQGVRYDITMWTDMTNDEFKSYQTNGKVGSAIVNSINDHIFLYVLLVLDWLISIFEARDCC